MRPNQIVKKLDSRAIALIETALTTYVQEVQKYLLGNELPDRTASHLAENIKLAEELADALQPLSSCMIIREAD